MTNLKDFIVRTRIDNTDEYGEIGSPEFDTKDHVFLEAIGDVGDLEDDKTVVYPSDYAIMNGAHLVDEYIGPKKDRRPTNSWLRSAESEEFVNIINYEDFLVDGFSTNESDPNYDDVCICPVLHLNLSNVISARSASDHFIVEPFKDKNGKVLYYTIEFGFYPQDKAKNSDELEKLFKTNKLTPTGKTYTGHMKRNGSFEQNKEFEYGGKKYVRVILANQGYLYEYKDKTIVSKAGTPVWAEVQPIKWRILNYDKLPKSINPNGKGTAKTIYVKSEEAIMSGIPFYPESNLSGEIEYLMWQNSPLRAFLNGYDLFEELNKGNGNKKFKADKNFKFKGKGFLEEAFDSSLTHSSTIKKEEEEEKEFVL